MLMRRETLRAAVSHGLRRFFMRQRFRLPLTIALTLLLLPGCAFLRWQKEKRRAAEEKRLAEMPKVPQLVGAITLVNADGGFVLIDSGSAPSPPVGTVIKSRTAGVESGELRVTEVRKRPFVIADIIKGTPQKGDPVFQ
jgi:cbb3-type cytochrome oxidase subunit 3